MLSKEQTANLLGVFTTVSIIGVGLAIGGPIGTSVMASIGINLSSTIIHQGSSTLKARWLSSDYGIHNSDIQHVLARALVKALTQLETKYFKLGQANALPENERESIKELFRELRQQREQVFAASLEQFIEGQKIEEYLTNEETISDGIWRQTNYEDTLSTYSEH